MQQRDAMTFYFRRCEYVGAELRQFLCGKSLRSETNKGKNT